MHVFAIVVIAAVVAICLLPASERYHAQRRELRPMSGGGLAAVGVIAFVLFMVVCALIAGSA